MNVNEKGDNVKMDTERVFTGYSTWTWTEVGGTKGMSFLYFDRRKHFKECNVRPI